MQCTTKREPDELVFGESSPQRVAISPSPPMELGTCTNSCDEASSSLVVYVLEQDDEKPQCAPPEMAEMAPVPLEMSVSVKEEKKTLPHMRDAMRLALHVEQHREFAPYVLDPDDEVEQAVSVLERRAEDEAAPPQARRRKKRKERAAKRRRWAVQMLVDDDEDEEEEQEDDEEDDEWVAPKQTRRSRDATSHDSQESTPGTSGRPARPREAVRRTRHVIDEADDEEWFVEGLSSSDEEENLEVVGDAEAAMRRSRITVCVKGEVEEAPKPEDLLPDRIDGDKKYWRNQTKLWMIRCRPGTEKTLALALMRKALDYSAREMLKQADKKDEDEFHVKSVIVKEELVGSGMLYVEARKAEQVLEAVHDLALPKNQRKWLEPPLRLLRMVGYEEMLRAMHVHKHLSLDAVQGKTWARIRRGCYRGDLARIIALNTRRSIVRVWLVPRVDYGILNEQERAMAEKRPRPFAQLLNVNAFIKAKVPLTCNEKTHEYSWKGKSMRFTKSGLLVRSFPFTSLIVNDVTPTDDELERFRRGGAISEEQAECMREVILVRKFVAGEKVEVLSGDDEGGVERGEVLCVQDKWVCVTTSGSQISLKCKPEQLVKVFSNGDFVKVIAGPEEGICGTFVCNKGTHMGLVLLETLKLQFEVDRNNLQKCVGNEQLQKALREDARLLPLPPSLGGCTKSPSLFTRRGASPSGPCTSEERVSHVLRYASLYNREVVVRAGGRKGCIGVVEGVSNKTGVARVRLIDGGGIIEEARHNLQLVPNEASEKRFGFKAVPDEVQIADFLPSTSNMVANIKASNSPAPAALRMFRSKTPPPPPDGPRHGWTTCQPCWSPSSSNKSAAPKMQFDRDGRPIKMEPVVNPFAEQRELRRKQLSEGVPEWLLAAGRELELDEVACLFPHPIEVDVRLVSTEKRDEDVYECTQRGAILKGVSKLNVCVVVVPSEGGRAFELPSEHVVFDPDIKVCVVDGHPDVSPLEVGTEGALLRIEGLDGAVVTSMGVEIFPMAALRKVKHEGVELRGEHV